MQQMMGGGGGSSLGASEPESQSADWTLFYEWAAQREWGPGAEKNGYEQ